LQTISTWQMHPTMTVPSMCMGDLWNSLLYIASCLKHQHNFVHWVFVVLVLACLGKKKSWYCALISMIIITSSQKTKYSWQGEFGLHRDLSLLTQFWSHCSMWPGLGQQDGLIFQEWPESLCGAAIVSLPGGKARWNQICCQHKQCHSPPWSHGDPTQCSLPCCFSGLHNPTWW
jgi:hypothetical protein